MPVILYCDYIEDWDRMDSWFHSSNKPHHMESCNCLSQWEEQGGEHQQPWKKQKHRNHSECTAEVSFICVTQGVSELPRNGHISKHVWEFPVVVLMNIVQQGYTLFFSWSGLRRCFPCHLIQTCTAVHVGLSRGGSLFCVLSGCVSFLLWIWILPDGLHVSSVLVRNILSPTVILQIDRCELLNSVRLKGMTYKRKKEERIQAIIKRYNTYIYNDHHLW